MNANEIIRLTALAVGIDQEYCDSWDPINNEADYDLLLHTMKPGISNIAGGVRCTVIIGNPHEGGLPLASYSLISGPCIDLSTLESDTRYLVLQTVALSAM